MNTMSRNPTTIDINTSVRLVCKTFCSDKFAFHNQGLALRGNSFFESNPRGYCFEKTRPRSLSCRPVPFLLALSLARIFFMQYFAYADLSVCQICHILNRSVPAYWLFKMNSHYLKTTCVIPDQRTRTFNGRRLDPHKLLLSKGTNSVFARR